MKIVFVAFNCQEDNSILYKKIEIETDKTDLVWHTSKQKLGEVLAKAIEKGADFCSVRFIKDKEEKKKKGG